MWLNVEVNVQKIDSHFKSYHVFTRYQKNTRSPVDLSITQSILVFVEFGIEIKLNHYKKQRISAHNKCFYGFYRLGFSHVNGSNFYGFCLINEAIIWFIDELAHNKQMKNEIDGSRSIAFTLIFLFAVILESWHTDKTLS